MQIKTGIGILILLVFSVIASAHAFGGVKAIQAPSATLAKRAISTANMARDKARSVDGEWRDIEELLNGAMAALKSGDYAKAISLANEARNQGELGYSQAMSQQGLQMPSYFKQ